VGVYIFILFILLLFIVFFLVIVCGRVFFNFHLCMVVGFVGVARASCTVEECADYLSDGVK